MGGIAGVLIVVCYFLNIRGKLKVSSPFYIWGNLIGGIFFIIYTLFKGAYFSMFVNVVWVIVALAALFKKKQ
jgi:hypothetical protein